SGAGKIRHPNQSFKRSWMTVTTITTRFRKAETRAATKAAAVADTEQNRVLLTQIRRKAT
ncbi:MULTISPECIES: hypothetical protein, partial [Hungatella]